MQQIVDWLKKLGMSDYAERFAENDIDMAVLPDLTDQHLKDLGVSLGHRLKMLRAIRDLGGASASATAPLAPMPTEQTRRDGAERRQLTIMFCDLVGSTALSAQLDPEDLRAIIGAYHRRCTELVERNGGFVAKYMGDGVLAYFGYPQAHEHDAERAVRGALALIETVPNLRAAHDAPLQVRVGLATGLVVVGDLIGEGDAQERGVVGETPNLAARLQALAEPGQLVISNSTRRLTGGMFEYHDLGKVSLKGLVDPVQAWQVLGASAVESRFEAQHGVVLTPLVGREEELELLLRRWQRAKSGEGQVVLLSGEPGIGKSRLTAALLERLATEPHTRLRYFCSPQHTDSALYPIISQIERAAGLAHDDQPQARLDKLDAVLGQTSTSIQDATLFAEMLSLPNDGRYPALELAPQQRRQRTLEALTAQLAGLANQRPVLMIFEDVHWIDPTSLEALGRTVDRVRTLSALLIVTFRPEFAAPWVGQSHVTSVTLNRLGEREASAIIARLVGNKELPADVMMEIVERTDGIPLFAEEMTKAVLEAESEGGGGRRRAVAAVPSPALAVPATLHASLMARLDHLGSIAREVAQIGAAIGREFSYELIAPVAQKPDAELWSALNRLTEAGLVFCRGTSPRASFLFKHALVRDVAYGTLLRERRQQLHGRIANVLAEQFPTIVEAEPEVLGHHYREAGMPARSSAYFERAGDRAAACSAYIEAIAHFKAAIEEADHLPLQDERIRRALTLLLKLGPAVAVTTGEWKPEVEAVYHRARELGREVGEGPELFKAIWGLWMYANRKGGGQSRKWTEELTSLAQRLGDESLLLEAQHCRWGDELYGGNHVLQLLETSAEGIRRYDPKRHAQLADAFGGHDPGVCALGCHATALLLRGLPDESRRTIEKAISLAEFLHHPPSIALAHRIAGQAAQIAQDREGCERMGERLVGLAERFDLPISRWYGRYFIGWAQAQGLTLSEGLAQMEEAFPLIVSEQGYKRDCGALAEMRFAVGRAGDALALVDHALNTGDGPSCGLWVAEIHRLRGMFLKSLGSPTEEVERALRTAVEIAGKQGALLLKLRASTSLARLWRDQGKRSEARDLLAPIYGWFTEGFDTPVLQDAKALLDELV